MQRGVSVQMIPGTDILRTNSGYILAQGKGTILNSLPLGLPKWRETIESFRQVLT